MALFKSRKNGANRTGKRPPEDVTNEPELQQELKEIVVSGTSRTIDRGKSEAERTIADAAVAQVRGIRLIEKGRCPDCGGRTEQFLFTAVCPTCGWFRRFASEMGRCVVQIDNGDTIECDRVFSVKGDQLLCVRGDVVRSQVARTAIREISYMWSDDELAAARERSTKERAGVCSWCEAHFEELADTTPIDEYIAFGAFQERYQFCSKKCLQAFRKQYPIRIHRNCYETECATCGQCIKRYEISKFKRMRLADELEHT